MLCTYRRRKQRPVSSVRTTKPRRRPKARSFYDQDAYTVTPMRHTCQRQFSSSETSGKMNKIEMLYMHLMYICPD